MQQHIALTESTFYVLMALYEKDTFGTEIVDYIRTTTQGRIPMGPGTLYTILAKFEKERLIKEVSIQGRKRTYTITSLGMQVFESEMDRLKELYTHAQKAMKFPQENRGEKS